MKPIPHTRRFLLIGYTAIVAVGATVVCVIWPTHWPAVVVTMVIGFVAANVISEVARRRLRRRVRQLRETADAITSGDLATHVEHPPHDDFFKLSDSLEHMLTRMRDSLVEQERLREQLCRSEKLALIGQLAAMVAHEVNNPLDGLQNGIRIIRRKGQHDQQSEELLELMDNGLYRIEMIVRRLLTLSRNEPIHPNPTPFDRLVEDALTFVRPKLNRNNIATDCDLGSPPVVGMIDENQFAHVLVNLMINAADAMPDGGTLTVRARPGDDPTCVLLEVMDTGIGIDEAHLPHVFEPFYTTKPSQQGSGLGLAVVERIVEAHDGRIEIDTTPGKGTRFAISLPAAGSESMNRAADSACTTSS